MPVRGRPVPPDDVPASDDDALAVATDPANLGPRRLAHLAATAPDRPFLTEIGDGRPARTFGYREVHERVLRWAALLEREGIGPGDRVVSTLPPSVDAVAVWFAAGLLGAYEVAVDPALRGEFLRHVLTDSGARLALVRPDHAEVVRRGVPTLAQFPVDPAGDPLAGAAPVPREITTAPSDVCCVIYTSGTTGPAKGVVLTWAQMTALLGRVPRSWFGPDEVTYAPWPMFHVTGRSPIVTMLDTGGRVMLRERFSRTRFWSDVLDHGVTHASLAAVAGLLAAEPGPAPGEHPLRIVLGGGPGMLRFAERFDVTVVANYGSTEIGFPITNRCYGPGTHTVAGWPRRGYRLRVVDERGDEVPAGEVGELHIRPPARDLMLREYLGLPELTSRATEAGWYRTGDAVRLREDGGVLFVDRLRDTIRRFGENISSSAVEHVVLGLDEVAECAVLGVPSTVAGQEVLLVVVPSDGALIDEAALVARLRDVLPRHALPLYVRVVEELPKTANGKVRKTDLAALAEGAWRRPTGH